MNKPILCLDFDGVINSYISGWRGADFIPDPPVDGAMAFLVEAVNHFEVVIFSSRSHQEGGITAMKNWVDFWLDKEFGWDKGADVVARANVVRNNVTYPLEKPAAFVTIDDRAIQFDGTWPSFDELRDFKPWNKKELLGAAVRRLGMAGGGY